MMVNFTADGIIFNLRTAGICIHDDKVLMCYFEHINVWSLPGGRCDMGEDSRTALQRECMEELAEEVEVKEPAMIMENFFAIGDKRYHEVLIVHYMNLKAGSKLFTLEEYEGEESYGKILFKWLKLSELEKYNILPKQICDVVRNPKQGLQYAIQK